jgi:two-component system, NtrC family, response regulator GlrR
MSEVAVLKSGGSSEEKVLAGLIGKAPAFKTIVSSLPMLASSEGAVLITGETGTGKELVARAIHSLSARAPHPFVAVNCGAFVETLLESELFGHERGAFTDAHARRHGLVAQAAGGTMLLDEVDTLMPRAQVALLRVLQEGYFRPLGAGAEQHSDVRYLAATNAPLDWMVQAGSFRADLFYRLCVFSVGVPSLRERVEDILPLAGHFLEKHASGPGRAPGLSDAAAEVLLAYDWPGNVRELESAMVRALPAARGGTVEAEDLGLPGMPSRRVPRLRPEALPTYKIQKRRVVEAFEQQYLRRLMSEHRGNVSRAARAAGKERRDLGKLLKRHGLNPRQFAT